MNCPFCFINNTSRINSTFQLWWCNDCRLQFSYLNQELTFLIVYYKNFRMCFFKNPKPICFIQVTEYPFNWKFITQVEPAIVELPLIKIHQKIEQLSKLVIFI